MNRLTIRVDPILPEDATIVIPQCGHPELTCACIQSIRQVEGDSPPIVLVDDGSHTTARNSIYQQQFANTTLIESPHQGVTAAWNTGAAASDTPYLVFLNNDVVAQGPWLSRLVSSLGEPRPCDVMNSFATPLLSGLSWRQERSLPQPLKAGLYATRFLQGWCLAICRDTFAEMGGFDQSMAYYFSDTDLQLRLLQQENFQDGTLVSVPSLPLRHLAHRTAHDTACFPNRRQKWHADRKAFLAKWNPAN